MKCKTNVHILLMLLIKLKIQKYFFRSSLDTKVRFMADHVIRDNCNHAVFHIGNNIVSSDKAPRTIANPIFKISPQSTIVMFQFQIFL